jgi:DNA-binding transcriptional LysR family regulator
MDIRDLGRLDLNLLVALEALLEEGNVSRAAQRVFVTQSAMSKTLGRLRDLFDDPLFIRRGATMVPTPRAEQLAMQLPKLLRSIQDMLAPPNFDPLVYEGEFNLLVQGHMGVWLLPRLMERLSESAPHIRLGTLSYLERAHEELNSGKLDFLLEAERQAYPADLRRTTVGFAPPLLLARKGHPLQGSEPSWQEVLYYPHVQLVIDELAEIQFLTGRQSSFMHHMSNAVPHIRTDQLLTAIEIVRHSDYLFPAPPLFLEQADISGELIALPLPEGEKVMLKYVMVNHQRLNTSAAHDFIYREILLVIDCFRQKYSLPTLAQLRAQRKLAY